MAASSAAGAAAGAGGGAAATYGSGDSPKVLLYGIHGSQFVAKVIFALKYRNVDFKLRMVNMSKIGEQTPGPNATVPVMEVTEGGKTELILDSTDMLKWIDRRFPDKDKELFPGGDDGAAFKLEDAADEEIDTYTRWFNWCDPEGFKASIAVQVKKRIPCIVSCCINPATVGPVKKKAAKYRARCYEIIGEDILATPESSRTGLRAALQKYEDSLGASEGQKYLVPGSKGPTAADFTFYAMMHRFIGDSGGMLDPCLPTLLDDGKLPRIAQWWNVMRVEHPFTNWKEHREPAEGAK